MIHCYVLYNSLFCHYINKRKGEPPDDVKLRLETPDKSDRRTGLPIGEKGSLYRDVTGLWRGWNITETAGLVRSRAAARVIGECEI